MYRLLLNYKLRFWDSFYFILRYWFLPTFFKVGNSHPYDFIEEKLPSRLDKISEVLNTAVNSGFDEDLIKRLRQLSHSLYGTSSTYNLSRIAELMRQIEKFAIDTSRNGENRGSLPRY